MKEDFLHYLWRLRKFLPHELKSTQGEILSIFNPGEHNMHAGPDFFNARIQIGDTQWAGNVEIHILSSDWEKHGHSTDKAYDNVILHVVFEEDKPVFRASGERIPCLEMKDRIPSALSKIYLKLLHNEHWIPCQHHFYNVSDVTKNLCLDRMLVERIEAKTDQIQSTLDKNNNHWEETFYQALARNFGLKINAEPFEMLARSLPLNILARHKNSLLQMEALLFGQAGLLNNNFDDDYPKLLQNEFSFLKSKFKLAPIPGQSWKFLRLRPANFPSIRIAQFAKLVHQSVHLFSKILETEEPKAIRTLFELTPSEYWKTHYVFDKPSAGRKKKIGNSTIDLLLINTVAPFLFLYGKNKDLQRFQERALRLLESIKAEQNSIIKNWKNLGMEPASAYQTQALLQLKKAYCHPKRCLECSIGSAILK